jgi:hypothetical protein
MERIKLLDVKPSRDGKTKLMAIFKVGDKERVVKFGIRDSFSYIDGADRETRDNYLKRHAKNIEKFENEPMSKSSLSAFITWGPTQDLGKNIQLYKKKYGI